MTAIKRYPVVRAPGHPVASKRGLALRHRVVLYDAIGPGVHTCYWCGVALVWRAGRNSIGGIVVDHLDHNKQNNAPSNLVPACNPCNGHRRGHDDWRPWAPGDPVGTNPMHTAMCRRGHPFTIDNVYHRPDNGGRQCRRCIEIRSLRRSAQRTDVPHGIAEGCAS